MKLFKRKKPETIDLAKKLRHKERQKWTHLAHLDHWTQASYANFSVIRDFFADYTCCVRVLGKKHENEACIITASGDSLTYDIPYLKQFKGVIITGITQFHTLWKHGIQVDYVVLYDSMWTQLTQIYPDVYDYNFTPDGEPYKYPALIANPLMDPMLIKKWKGKVYFYVAQSPVPPWLHEETPLTVQEFIDKHVKSMDEPISKYIRGEFDIFNSLTIHRAYRDNDLLGGALMVSFPNVGCTNNMEICLASFLGCKPIGMAGFDAGANVGDMTRFDQIRYDRATEIESHIPRSECRYHPEIPPVSEFDDGATYGFGGNKKVFEVRDGCYTTEEFLGYSIGLYKLSCNHDNQMFELSPDGQGRTLEIFPIIPIQDYVNDPYQYKHLYLPKRDRYHRVNDYFQKQKWPPLAKPEWYDNPEYDAEQDKKLASIMKIP